MLVWTGVVNFLHSRWYGAVLWICTKNGANNMSGVVIAEKRLLVQH